MRCCLRFQYLCEGLSSCITSQGLLADEILDPLLAGDSITVLSNLLVGAFRDLTFVSKVTLGCLSQIPVIQGLFMRLRSLC